MKSLIKYLLAIALFFNAFTLFAQSKEDFKWNINGYMLSGKHTTQDIINKFGTPLTYDPLSPDTGEGEEFRREFFGYGEAFCITLNGYREVSGFYITSPGYTLFNGYLKVGDNISKLDLLNQLGVGQLEPGKYGVFRFFMGDNSLIFHTENHIIKIIDYYVPD